MTYDYKDENTWLMFGDCLYRMKEIQSESIDMIMVDLPYGTTQCKWDSVIDLQSMWEIIWNVTKPNAAVVMTAQTPFDKVLGCSQLKYLKYEWVWEKKNGSNWFLECQKSSYESARKHSCILQEPANLQPTEDFWT